jgi:hypothetical protein
MNIDYIIERRSSTNLLPNLPREGFATDNLPRISEQLNQQSRLAL